MKTLRQIREDHDSKFIPLDTLSKQMLFEGSDSVNRDRREGLAPRDKEKKISRASPIPSSKDMPVMLIFRRMQYRVFPDQQVVEIGRAHV